jgi:DNA (cytosine-5)-methyltransferase 1
MSKPRIADLFCGAGGAGMGLHRAGFEVVGFDLAPQPRYPFEFHQQDALTVDLSDFDAVWASPPCQDYSLAIRHLASEGYPRLIREVRDLAGDMPFIIENVPGAPIPNQPTLFGDYGLQLCGTMFGLRRVRRHRLFLTSIPMTLPRGCSHREYALNPYNSNARKRDGIQFGAMTHYGKAMGVDWMKGKEIGEAIPPAYSEYLGAELLATLTESAAHG